MTNQPTCACPARQLRSREAYQLRALIIKAMAHPSRLMIIDALTESEVCVCDLQRIVGSDMSTVSKHLSVLKAAGIVKDRKVGLQVFYRLRVPCITQFFGCVEAVMEARFAPVGPEIATQEGAGQGSAAQFRTHLDSQPPKQAQRRRR